MLPALPDFHYIPYQIIGGFILSGLYSNGVEDATEMQSIAAVNLNFNLNLIHA